MQIYLPVPPDETFASPAGADDYENKIDPCSTRFSNETRSTGGEWVSECFFLGGGGGEERERCGLTATLKRDSGETRVEVFSGVGIKWRLRDIAFHRPTVSVSGGCTAFTLDFICLQVAQGGCRCRFCHAFGILFRPCVHRNGCCLKSI